MAASRDYLATNVSRIALKRDGSGARKSLRAPFTNTGSGLMTYPYAGPLSDVDDGDVPGDEIVIVGPPAKRKWWWPF